MPEEPPSVPEQSKPRGFRAWWRHAFAIEPYDETSLSDEDQAILKKIAGQIHERKLTAAAIMAAHSNRHMNWLTSQFLVFCGPVFHAAHPFINAITRNFGLGLSPVDYPKLQAALEKRYSFEYLIQLLEGHAAGDYNSPSATSPAQPVPPPAEPSPETERKDIEHG